MITLPVGAPNTRLIVGLKEQAPVSKSSSSVVSIVKPSVDFKTLAQMEQEHIERALELTSGSKSKAAEILGVSTKTLYNKLHSYGIFDKYEASKKGAK